MKRSTRARAVTAAADKYRAGGWTVIFPPQNHINDLIAAKETRAGVQMHFIQVMTEDTADNAAYHGDAKNTFIQNAYSNAARPIHVYVGFEGASATVTARDVDAGTRKRI